MWRLLQNKIGPYEAGATGDKNHVLHFVKPPAPVR